MFPIIDKRKTGINIRRIMDMRGLTVKDVQEYLNLEVCRVYIIGLMVSACQQ